jgi:hypothetical protein
MWLAGCRVDGADCAAAEMGKAAAAIIPALPKKISLRETSADRWSGMLDILCSCFLLARASIATVRVGLGVIVP